MLTADQIALANLDDPNVMAAIRQAAGKSGEMIPQRVVVTIPAASVKTLNATAYDLVAAPPSGFFWELASDVHARLNYGSAGYDSVAATDYFEIRMSSATGALLTQNVSPAGFGDATTTKDFCIAKASSYVPVNAKLVAHLAGGEWYSAAGDSSITLEFFVRCRSLAPA